MFTVTVALDLYLTSTQPTKFICSGKAFIAKTYHSSKLKIYATITYYLTHRQQLDNYLEQRRQNAQQYRQKLTQDNNLVHLRERLLARHQLPSELSANASSE